MHHANVHVFQKKNWKTSTFAWCKKWNVSHQNIKCK
jgi:hypothetical protein